MNQTPVPVDLSKLKSVLSGAKAVMKKDIENQGGSRGPQMNHNQGYSNNSYSQPVDYGTNTDGYLTESQMQQMNGGMNHQMQGGYPQQMGPDPTRQMGQITKESIMNSNMPDAIKQAMLKNPIQQANMNHTFSLDDVSDLIEPPRHMQQPQQVQQPRVQQPRINEAVIQNNDTFTVSESSLRAIIKDVLIEYLTTDYSKNLTEATIKKTINTLIKEGKIKTKK